MRSPDWPSRDAGRETCAWCGTPIVQPRTGRPRRWCTTAHAAASYHLRVQLRAEHVDVLDPEDVEFWLAEHGRPTSLAGAM